MDDGHNSLLDPGTLRDLLVQLEQTDVDELEVVSGSSRLFLRREPEKRRARAGEGAAAYDRPEGIPIVAPLTGVYYSRPMPDEPAFVTAGSEVEVGDRVALIETMKLFNEVITEVAGVVQDIVVQDGDLVEAGHPMMYLRPRGEAE